MTRLIRIAAFVAGSVLIAGAAMAGVPNWTNSTQPDTLGVGVAGFDPGSIDNYIRITYTIRDVGNTPVNLARVEIDFSGCPDVQICPQSKQEPGTTVLPAAGGFNAVVSRLTDVNGQVSFLVRGRSNGIAGPFHTLPCAAVSAYAPAAQGGGFAGQGSSLRAFVFDLDPTGAALSSDLAVWSADANECAGGGQYRARSDFNQSGYFVATPCPGAIQALDLAMMSAFLNEVPSHNCNWTDTNP